MNPFWCWRCSASFLCPQYAIELRNVTGVTIHFYAIFSRSTFLRQPVAYNAALLIYSRVAGHSNPFGICKKQKTASCIHSRHFLWIMKQVWLSNRIYCWKPSKGFCWFSRDFFFPFLRGDNSAPIMWQFSTKISRRTFGILSLDYRCYQISVGLIYTTVLWCFLPILTNSPSLSSTNRVTSCH